MAGDLKLDKATIMGRLGGDEEIFAVMVDMYLQDADSYCDQLAAALAAGDAPLLHREAHTVKGVLATFADEEGSAMALRLENQARSGDLAGLAVPVAELQARLRRWAEVMQKEMPASGA